MISTLSSQGALRSVMASWSTGKNLVGDNPLRSRRQTPCPVITLTLACTVCMLMCASFSGSARVQCGLQCRALVDSERMVDVQNITNVVPVSFDRRAPPFAASGTQTGACLVRLPLWDRIAGSCDCVDGHRRLVLNALSHARSGTMRLVDRDPQTLERFPFFMTVDPPLLCEMALLATPHTGPNVVHGYRRLVPNAPNHARSGTVRLAGGDPQTRERFPFLMTGEPLLLCEMALLATPHTGPNVVHGYRQLVPNPNAPSHACSGTVRLVGGDPQTLERFPFLMNAVEPQSTGIARAGTIG